MPFIGKDWRSPGEAWVKTESLGWQRMKIIESQLRPACHPAPACSWPPRSESGQHMAAHCAATRPDAAPETVGGDGGAGRGQSLSPMSSPERQATSNHRAITISSPYGQYTCCNHHFEPLTPPSSPTLTSKAASRGLDNMARSLSREQLRTTTAQATDERGAKMLYNNSVSDFRSSTRGSLEADNMEPTTTSGSEQISSTRVAAPILLENGHRIITSSSSSPLSDCDQQQQPQQHNCCCSGATTCTSLLPKEPYVRAAPHCRVSVRTREVAMYNTISEAFYRLDFCNAIHDIRRFNYICKLLHLLITQNLTSLSGCATKVLFNMLEQVAWEVSINKRNIHVLKNLLNELKQMIQKYYCWGRPIGSSLLWQQHFDTIERISLMVDSIELSQPIDDASRPTFNELPVEMVREILLRLNDYRDLVNSAQASSVMRSMINGQYIWQQLCRYHFTGQQLRLALDSGASGMFANRGNKLRGVKYARTTSADGKTSFRNPVTHKQQQQPPTNNTNSSTTTTRQQIEATSGRRGQARQASSHTERKEEEQAQSSYVTRAIRIFDKAGSSTTLGSTTTTTTAIPTTSEGLVKEDKRRQQRGEEDGGGGRRGLLNSNYRPDHEIDWERVFHQLRKKFDLKEEYADCLLLCRHCRCLFWKSFGHPCMGQDDLSFELIRPPSASSSATTCSCDGSSQVLRQQQQQQPQQHQQGHRVSVAMLSRNFDRGPQRAAAVSRPSLGQELGAASGQENVAPLNGVGHVGGARPRGRPMARLAGRRLDEAAREENNNNNNLPIRRSDDLVPKHVAISPQAFLKFFSL